MTDDTTTKPTVQEPATKAAHTQTARAGTTLGVASFPPMRDDESTVVTGADARRINAHCENMANEITRLRDDLTRQIDINTSLASECESLREANKELVAALDKLLEPDTHGKYGGPLVSVTFSYEDGDEISYGHETIKSARAALAKAKEV